MNNLLMINDRGIKLREGKVMSIKFAPRGGKKTIFGKPTSLIVSCLAVLLVTFVPLIFEGCAHPLTTNPSEILKEAYASQSRLRSVKVRLRLDIRLMDSPGGKELLYRSLTGTGEYEHPDRSRMITKSDSNITEVITIGDKSYVRTEKENWVRKSASGLGDVARTVQNISNLLKLTKQLRLKGVKGNAYHLTFRISLSELKGGFTPSNGTTQLPRGTVADVDLWVEKKNFRVRRLRIKQSGEASGLPGGFVTTMIRFEFYDFDKPVSIEAPF